MTKKKKKKKKQSQYAYCLTVISLEITGECDQLSLRVPVVNKVIYGNEKQKQKTKTKQKKNVKNKT